MICKRLALQICPGDPYITVMMSLDRRMNFFECTPLGDKRLLPGH